MLPPLALAEAWRAYHNGPASQATAKQWLQGRGSAQQIRTALWSVLARLWSQAFGLGLQAVGGLSMAVLAELLRRDMVNQLAGQWLDEITDTYLGQLAAVLAAGGTQAEIARELSAVLGDTSHAELIAVTEQTRADNAGRMAALRQAQVPMVRWVTHSADPCPHCIGNEAAGPWPLGQPFPSGDTAPPAHPNCQCTLEHIV